MVKTLQVHGNSRALVFDKTMLEMLGITADTPLQLTFTNGSIVVTPANVGIGRDAVLAVTAKMRARYGQTLKDLAE